MFNLVNNVSIKPFFIFYKTQNRLEVIQLFFLQELMNKVNV